MNTTELLNIFIFLGVIWVVLTWRCYAVYVNCREVEEGKLSKEALIFQYFQCVVSLLLAIHFSKNMDRHYTYKINVAVFYVTFVWFFFFCSRTLLRLFKKNQVDK